MSEPRSLFPDVPGVPDYPRLRAEIEAGHYPFLPEDEAELFARCEHLEAANVRLRAALERIEATCDCTAEPGGSKHTTPCAYHIARGALYA